jgi:hypothetical protein
MTRKYTKPTIVRLTELQRAYGHCQSGGKAEATACLSGESTANPKHICDAGGGGADNPFQATDW